MEEKEIKAGCIVNEKFVIYTNFENFSQICMN